MASSVFSAHGTRSGSNLAKRFVNALVASRAQAASRELRRLEVLVRETALVHGEIVHIGLEEADVLPFNR